MRHRLTLKLTGMKGKNADCLEENELGEGGFGNRLILRIYLFFPHSSIHIFRDGC
jgi:hypothetical protein